MLFFRRMGLKAERQAHARLFFNNRYAGLYTIVESVDKVFLKKNFGEDTSNLYEFAFDNSVRTRRRSSSSIWAATPTCTCRFRSNQRRKENDTQPQVHRAADLDDRPGG